MSVATDKRVNSVIPAIAIGLTVVFEVYIGGPVTGGSMNPARSLGPALFAGGRSIGCYWVYFAGPAIGAILGSRFYESIRGGEKYAKNASFVV
jgi:glycerol uptake facilitator-like aquaporin